MTHVTFFRRDVHLQQHDNIQVKTCVANLHRRLQLPRPYLLLHTQTGCLVRTGDYSYARI